MAKIGFNLADAPADSTNEPLPAGKYDVVVDDAELVPTKAGTGQMVRMAMTVTGPTHRGRKIWDRLNIDNPNPKAVEIAQRRLAQIAKALGKAGIDDTDELVGVKLKVTVKVREASGGYEASNDVSGYGSVAEGGDEFPVTPAKPKPAPAKGSTKDEGLPW